MRENRAKRVQVPRQPSESIGTAAADGEQASAAGHAAGREGLAEGHLDDGPAIGFQREQVGLLQARLVKANLLPIQLDQVGEVREEGVETLGEVESTSVVLELSAFVRTLGVGLASEGVEDGVEQLERVRVFDGDRRVVNGGDVASLR